MANVKWIKIYTNMISNKKIKRIRKLPEGNNIILIWVFLLAAAGECNRSGALFLTDTMPFKADDLAVEFDFDVSVMNFALLTLEKFTMIEIFEEVIYIKNWDEYQNVEGMDKIREQTRIRTANYRKKLKQLQLSNVTCDVTVTHGDDIRERELELEKELSLSISENSSDRNEPEQNEQKKGERDATAPDSPIEKKSPIVLPKMNILDALNKYKLKQDGGVKWLEDIESYQGFMEDALILDAIKLSAGKKYSFCKGILSNWKDEGYRKQSDHPDHKPMGGEGIDQLDNSGERRERSDRKASGAKYTPSTPGRQPYRPRNTDL